MNNMSSMELAIMNEIDYILWNEFTDDDLVLFDLENKKIIKDKVLNRAYQYVDRLVIETIEEFKEKNKEESEL